MNHKILVVDNDLQSLDIINQILGHSLPDNQILRAESGDAALQILADEKPDIVITDWDMPNMNGIELLKSIRQNPDTERIPVIVCSGVMLEMKHLKTALEAGAVDFIRKPIETVELVARVNSMLRLVHSYEQLVEEREIRRQNEVKHFQDKIEQQTAEITAKALTLGKYNQLLKIISTELSVVSKQIGQETENLHLSDIVSRININIYRESWEDFSASFKQTNPTFFENLMSKHPDLTKNEMKLCALLKLDLSSKEITTITQQTLRSVEIARFRMRRKLNLGKSEQIVAYLNKF